jgi:hypothetical protein
MPDGYMNPENVSAEPEATETQKTARDRSTVQFPYMDLDTAVEVARVMRDRGGNAPFSKDQLAAALGHAATSGALAAKIHAARMFGLIDNPTPGRFRVSQLGFEAVDPDQTRAASARVEAFLRVPLYRRTYEDYRGKTLPSRPHGLERIFIEFGVAPKRGGNARLAFERSARQAGFFEHGEDRLVAPLVTSPADGGRAEDPSRPPHIVEAVGSVRGTSHVAAQGATIPLRHQLIEGLFRELPEPPAEWGTAERVRWLRLAASMFDVLYERQDTAVAIEVKTSVE